MKKITRTTLRERRIPFIVKAPMLSKNAENRRVAFERLEAARVKNIGLADYEQDLGNALDAKYGNFD